MELELVIKQTTAMLKTSVKKRFSLLILCFTIAFLSLNFGVANAQFTSVTNETLVNTSTAGEQWAYWWSVRTVAVQPDGGYISIWIDNNGLDGSGQGIFGQRFSASGAKVGGQFQVNTTTTGDQFSPSVAVAPNGSFLVAWEGPGTSIDVFGQFFSKNGVKIGTEFLLSTIVIGGQTSPEVQYYPDGTFVAGYIDGGQSVLQRFDAEGRTIGLETRISSGTGNVVLDAIAIRPDNSLVMTWESGGDVYGQCFSSTLQPIGSQIRLNTYTVGTQEYAVCRADALGNFVVVWQSHGQDGSGIGIYGRRYDNNFNPLSGEFAVTTNTTNDQIEPQIAMEPSGRFIIAWTDFNNRDAGGPDGTSVWIREFNNSGVPVGVETRVNQSVTGYQAYPVIDMNASGRIALDWEANGTQPGQIDNYGVFTRTYQLTQTGTTSISVVPTNGTASDIVTVTMTLTNPTSIANVKPNPLSVSGTNDVFATLLSGPTPASATVGTSPVTFTWTYRLTANGSAGSLTFGGNAHSSGGAIFPYSTSNSITVKPALYLSDITAPNLIGDQNVESHPEQGPRVFTIGAKITNAGLTPLTQVSLYLGNGVTPGVFPVTNMTLAQTNNTYQGAFSLVPLGGTTDCSRSLISLAPSKSIIAGGIDFNGDNVVNAFDDGVLGNGKTVIDGRVDVDLSGTITIADDIAAPPGVFTGYREPPVIDGYVDVNRDGIINASDAGTYGGEIKNVYWQVAYEVLDASGKATWGQTSDYADDLRYKWSIWASAKDGAITRTDMVNDYAKVRSEISALANKITPNPDGYISGGPSRVLGGQVDVNSDGVINGADDGFFYAKPVIDGKVDMNNSGTITTADDGLLIGFPVIDGFIDVNNSGTITSADDGLLVQPGQTFSITVHNAEFGTIGSGFDENRDNLWDLDFWYQPVGEVNWPSGAFRLIDIQADITGHGGNNPLNNITTHYSNEPYLSRLFNDNNGETGGFNGTYTYTFVALGPANGVLSPYQEAASGTNNEKYNGDYGVGINIYVGGLLCLGDRVWKDDNGNGIQDAGEPGIAGVTISLLNATGQIVATTTTDAFGNYKFCSILPGDYSLRITPPANYSLSPKTQGGDINLDSDFDPVTYTTAIISLYPNQGRIDIDAGLKFTQPSTQSIGDRVWLDTNADGVQDAGEPGISNVLVTLYNSSNVAVRSTYTDVNGNYLFTDVTVGTYTIGVSLPPAFIFSPNNGAISGATNSDIIPGTGRTASFTVNAGDQITYVDAGLKTQQTTNGTIGDYLWNDINKNGTQEAGEPGIAGVTVRLVNATTNTIIATTTTDATGKYIFNDVPAGNYKVEFVTPAGYTVTTKLSADPLSSNTDSDVEAATSRTATFALAAGQRITTVDAGYWLTTAPGTGKIGDRVWLDANQNGIQDAGEAGVAGMTVTLYDAGNIAIKQATTDQNGNYIFTDLAAGNYTVGFSNVPTGFTFTTTGAGTAATGSDANPATGRTATIVLAAGQTNLDVDAGIRSMMAGTASIGNRVWTDLNNNGLQDAGEPGIQGITVELLDAAGNPIDKDPVTPGVQPTITVTNALGEYLFTGLPAGDYKVRFSTLPAGYNAAPKGAGTDRTLDSDGNPVSGGSSTTDVFSVASGDERLDIDLGLFSPTAPLGQVGDRVWFDANNNGIQDAGEQGVPGVSVSLVTETGTVVATSVTDAFGIYKFVNVADAVYWIQFTNLPSGFNFSGMDLGGNDNTDSDADPVTGKTATFFISGGNTDLTLDAGIYSTRAALGDYVWFDADKDGTQDAAEKGIAGITVSLYDAGNNIVASTITDQNGRYFFSNLNPGTYTVGFGTIPSKMVFTTKDVVAAGDAADSDVDPATGKTAPVTLTAGQVNLTVDAGLKPFVPATIGDFVWLDLDLDGLQDVGEPGIAGMIVTLYNSANQPIGSAVTDGNGFYQISNVAPGTGYYIKFSNQPDPASSWTIQNVGGAAANNNSKADATGQTAAFNVTEGQIITNMDAGLVNPASLGDRVWFDANANGIQDATETGGISGVTVQLRNSAAVVIATTTTNASGNYLFSGLAAGNYSVVFPVSIGSMVLTLQNIGANDDIDSDPAQATGATGTITLTAGQNVINVDAGFYCNVNAGTDGSTLVCDNSTTAINLFNLITGEQSGGTWTKLTGTGGTFVAASGTYTPATGATTSTFQYTITGTAPCANDISIATVNITPQANAGADGNTLVCDNSTTAINLFNLITGEQTGGVWTRLTGTGGTFVAASGTYTPAAGATTSTFQYTITGTAPCPNDVSIATVNITPQANAGADGGTSVCDISTTAINLYSLITGEQSGGVWTRLTGTGGTFVAASGTFTPAVGATTSTFQYTISGTAPCPNDFSIATVTIVQCNGSIGDRVWRDDNGNGIQDAGEVGLAGITVVLLNSTGQIMATTTTDANGNYKFSNVLAGDYTVRITPPANYSLAPKTQGGDTNLDSDFDPVSYTTGTITLAPGQTRTDIDAGLKFTQPSTSSIGDRVWLDTNGDGVQNAGEPGVSNVLVTLYNSVGTPVRSTYTDANGNYLFTDVTPGTYSIGVSLPPAFVFSPNSGVISGATNSDIIPATGRTASFVVNAGDQITYVDAGVKPQQIANGTIGDYVWNDINKNGTQEAGEPGIAGVTVRLVNATTNAIIATTTTDATGEYIFNDVPAGNYKVDFVTPAGYTITTKLGTDPQSSNTDSDVDPATSRTATFALAAGQRITSVDAGYWLTTPPGTSKIGDRVWHDANQNGIQDAGEASVQGITVTLYDAANTAIKLTVTDANGNYIFTDLAAGNYTVGFSNVPTGFTFTTTGAGTAATGSDANPATGRTATITLAAGQTNLDVDAGIRSAMAGTASIGNKVWYDLNNNGLQDAGELGIQGITVELLDAAGNPIDKDPVTPGVQPTITVTNALGEYLFTGLPAGDYKVRLSTLPAGYNAAPKGVGTDRTLDSDGNPVSGGSSTTDVFSVAAGDERLDIDLGLFNPTAPLGQIGDRVWFDANNNGVQDAGEQGVPGVTVSLLNASNVVIVTTVTDGTGTYKFVNLANATYSVQFSNLPSGFVFSPKDLGGNDNTDSDADPVTGKTGTYVISGGASNMTIDAGIYSTRAALGDYVWFDADNDGIQDAGENGMAGITVTLYNTSNIAVASAITDQSGRYFFSNLNPGTYTVGFGTIPSKMVFTAKDVVAAGDAADSDVDPATGKTGAYTLVAGQVNLTIDAGLKPYLPATIGDFVWLDLDRDGLQDANEPGIAGVIVTLYNSSNQPIGSAITDGNGFYQISNVAPGTGYYLKFSNQPDPAAPWTLQNVGGTAASNNSKVDATGQTAPFNVTEGQIISNSDAGLYKIININGNVWHDANGLTDLQINRTSNQSIPNTLYIYLVDANTNQIVQLESPNVDGTFRFTDVEMNKSYVIVLSSVLAFPGQSAPIPFLPSGWQRVGENLGAGPLSGSDGIPDGMLFLDTETSDVFDANFGIRLRSGEVVIG